MHLTRVISSSCGLHDGDLEGPQEGDGGDGEYAGHGEEESADHAPGGKLDVHRFGLKDNDLIGHCFQYFTENYQFFAPSGIFRCAQKLGDDGSQKESHHENWCHESPHDLVKNYFFYSKPQKR